MQLTLESLHCMSHGASLTVCYHPIFLIFIAIGTLMPVAHLRNIEQLNHIEAFGFQMLDLDADTVLPHIGQISSPKLYSLTICYSLTLLGDTPLDLLPSWETFKTAISDVSRFPHLVGLDITIYDAAQCGMLFLRLMEYSLKCVFVSLHCCHIRIRIHICGQ